MAELNVKNREIRKVRINSKKGFSGFGELIGYDIKDQEIFCVKIIDRQKSGPGRIQFFHKSELEELENGN